MLTVLFGSPCPADHHLPEQKNPCREDPDPCGPGRKCAIIERIITHVRCTWAEEVAKELNEKTNPNKHGIIILRNN